MIRQWIGAIGLSVVCVASIEAGPMQGQGRGRGQSGQSAEPAAPVTASIVIQFGPRDRELITTYFAQPASGLPPGLAKRHDGLPPGLEKQLQRNGTLPPGLQKKLQRFPTSLERQLTPLPTGYIRGVIGSHVLIYASGTHVIADVVLNIAR